MKFLILISLVLSISNNAFAGQAHLRSSEGYRIYVYYDINHDDRSSNKPNVVNTFYGVLVEVQGNFRPTDRVQAVLINKLMERDYCQTRMEEDFQEVYSKDLSTGDVGIFQGEMTKDVYVRNRSNGEFMFARSLTIYHKVREYCRTLESRGQEVAIAVNGRWLTDPLTGKHNFTMDLR